MTLYDKGINNYQQTMDFCNNHMDNIKSGKNCGKEQENYDRYAKELIINRLYYSLFQIMYSFVDTDSDAYKDHSYFEIDHRVYITLISGECREQKESKLCILKSIFEIHSLRKKCDYRTDYPANKFAKHLKKIKDTYRDLQLLGVEKC